MANQPDNLNFLSPLGYKFVIAKLPNVNYFCQTSTIPAISMQPVSQPTPFVDIPRPGGKIIFEPLTIRFKVDEDLTNYIEVVNWLVGLGHPVSFEQTRALSSQSVIPDHRDGKGASLVSDGTMVILTSHKNPNKMVRYIDMFPISLTELAFDSTDSDVTYLEATATFRYTRYTIESVN